MVLVLKYFLYCRLSHLSVHEVVNWLSNQKCVPIDMKDHVQAFKEKEVNGLSLWKYCVKNPTLLRTSLGITSEIKRATLTQVCFFAMPVLRRLLVCKPHEKDSELLLALRHRSREPLSRRCASLYYLFAQTFSLEASREGLRPSLGIMSWIKRAASIVNALDCDDFHRFLCGDF